MRIYVISGTWFYKLLENSFPVIKVGTVEFTLDAFGIVVHGKVFMNMDCAVAMSLVGTVQSIRVSYIVSVYSVFLE